MAQAKVSKFELLEVVYDLKERYNQGIAALVVTAVCSAEHTAILAYCARTHAQFMGVRRKYWDAVFASLSPSRGKLGTAVDSACQL